MPTGRPAAGRGWRVRPPTARQALLLIGVFVITVIAAVAIGRQAGNSTAVAPENTVAGSRTPRSDLPAVAVAALPQQARDTLALIERGGPYPYRQDNTVFGNNEGRLPTRAAGYYREYTVPTLGSDDRGVRRLVLGRDGDIFYTNDHYDTFRQVLRPGDQPVTTTSQVAAPTTSDP